jgi:hypothetical protein
MCQAFQKPNTVRIRIYFKRDPDSRSQINGDPNTALLQTKVKF